MAGNRVAQRSLREKSCREPQWLAHQIGTPLPDPARRDGGVAGNHGRQARGVAERKCKAAERKLKALFAPPRPPPPAGAACRQVERGAAQLGLDRRRRGGGARRYVPFFALCRERLDPAAQAPYAPGAALITF
jgi:hypothetical protein